MKSQMQKYLKNRMDEPDHHLKEGTVVWIKATVRYHSINEGVTRINHSSFADLEKGLQVDTSDLYIERELKQRKVEKNGNDKR